MKFLDGGLVVPLLGLQLAGKPGLHRDDRFFLPAMDDGGMDPKLGGSRGDRGILPQRRQGDLGFEGCRILISGFAHLFPPVSQRS